MGGTAGTSWVSACGYSSAAATSWCSAEELDCVRVPSHARDVRGLHKQRGSQPKLRSAIFYYGPAFHVSSCMLTKVRSCNG
jgi:hypothetical protein